MRKIIALFAAITALSILFVSCGSGNKPTGTSDAESAGAVTSDPVADPTNDDLIATGEFSVSPSEGVSVKGNTFTVTSAGEYTFKGALEGSVVVDAGDEDEVVLIFDGVTLSSSDTAPVYVKNAGEVSVKSAEKSYNTITDNRAPTDSSASDGSTDGNAAIWSDCDLKINGKGTLIVTSSYDNGIKSKDDLTVKNVMLKVTSPGVALKGNDTVEIKSGSLILISTESDGIKTSNTDVSSKGNQRGTVTISGGNISIYSACDGISAAYDVVINQEEDSVILNVYTADYSENAEEISKSDKTYLIIPASLYSESNSYYGYFFSSSGSEGEWVKFEFETMVSGGMSSSYYGLTANVPSSYDSVIFRSFSSGESPSDDTTLSGGGTVNSSMNGYLISDSSDGVLTGDWVNLSSGSGSSEKTTWSSKGIKASNAVSIEAGTITVYAMDDGVHANSDSDFDNGKAPEGRVTISGGTLNVTSADDGVHADGELVISGGTVNVAESHEGLEGNVISIEGGTVTVYGKDDGINACKGAKTTEIRISGGTVTVTTPSGDTDAIDSNGNITISGGLIIVRGGASMGGMAGSVDLDGSISVTGGTIIAFGGICEVPSGGSGANVYISNGTSFKAGDYTLTDASGNTIASFNLDSSYNSLWIASDALTLNGSYSLTCGGSEVLSWTQSSTSSGDSVSGGFGPGSFSPGGGFGQGGGRG